MGKREAKAAEAAAAQRDMERESRLFVAAMGGDRAAYLNVCKAVEDERRAEYSATFTK